jgi:signal transduction histidine kinase
LPFEGMNTGRVCSKRIDLRSDRWCKCPPASTLAWRVNGLRPPASARLGTLSLFAILLSILLGGCQHKDESIGREHPVIEFTSVPVAGAGDSGRVSTIRGRVYGAKPGQRIVLYSYTDIETTWWVQPFAYQPFTEIRADSTWKSSAHPGNLYAALLVGPEFRPPPTAAALPIEGVLAEAITQGELPIWLRWWFVPVCVVAGLLAVFGFHRLRLHQMTKRMKFRFDERLAERMRVAQELHDTLLQGVISASMQLDVAVDHLPADSPVQPALRHILQIMGQVIEEGRTTLRGLRSSTENAHDMEVAFLRIPEDLGASQKLAYHVLVEGTPLPLQAIIHDEVYSIGREAIVNAFRHSGASNIEVELEYTASRMRVLVRDDGCGIKPEVLRSGRDGHWGLSGMRERAERIGAKFKVMSGPDAGTEVELSVPGHIVFQSPPSNGRWGWFSKSKLRTARAEAPKIESEILK